MQLLPYAGKPVVVAIQAREVMQLRPCAGKPVVAALQARENLWRLQFKYGKLCNCCHARKTCGGCNTGAGNYATAAMRENLWRLQYKHGKLCNCDHAREKPVVTSLQAR